MMLAMRAPATRHPMPIPADAALDRPTLIFLGYEVAEWGKVAVDIELSIGSEVALKREVAREGEDDAKEVLSVIGVGTPFVVDPTERIGLPFVVEPTERVGLYGSDDAVGVEEGTSSLRQAIFAPGVVCHKETVSPLIVSNGLPGANVSVVPGRGNDNIGPRGTTYTVANSILQRCRLVDNEVEAVIPVPGVNVNSVKAHSREVAEATGAAIMEQNIRMKYAFRCVVLVAFDIIP